MLSLLEGIRVLELAGSPAGAWAGRLFADCGASVVLVEPVAGADLRGSRPEVFAYLSCGKTSWGIDLTTPEGRGELESVLPGTDVLIESSAPRRLEPMAFDIDLESLIRLQISPFGLEGPRSEFLSNEMTDDAWSGHLYLNGEPDREPIVRPGLHAHYQAGAHGFIGALAALRARRSTGRGQTVETTHLEGLASLHQYTTVMWTQAGHKLRREGNRQGGHYHPVGIYPCRDGSVSLSMPVWEMMEPWLRAAGLDEVLEDPRFNDDYARGAHKDEFDRAIAPWLESHDARAIIDLAQSVRSPVGPVSSFLEVIQDPHLESRRVFGGLQLDGERLRAPRAGFLVTGERARLLPWPAEVGDEAPDWQVRRLEARASNPVAPGPLAGVRVLDLTRVWAGPLATRILGDLGADVIKVEATWGRGPAEIPQAAAEASHLFADNRVGEQPFNRGASFNKLNRSKRSLTLDLDRGEAREIFLSLVEKSDVVIENYSPGVLDRLRLGAKVLREINPSLVVVSMPGFGSSGPYRDWLAFGPLIEAASGLNAEMGYEDSPPYRSGIAWPDPVTGLHAAAVTLAALERRDRLAESAETATGATVEVAMLEALVATCGEEILRAQIRGEPPRRSGSRSPFRAPQGCYPCRREEDRPTDDRWIAISVESDAQWSALCSELDLPFAATLGESERRARHDEIDRALAERTRDLEAPALALRLQEARVPAALVADVGDLVDDPQLEHLGFWPELDHREVGRRRYPGMPIRFSETPARIERGAPCLGEHNREILKQLLGWSDEAIRVLEEGGILVDRPPPGATGRKVRLRARESHRE